MNLIIDTYNCLYSIYIILYNSCPCVSFIYKICTALRQRKVSPFLIHTCILKLKVFLLNPDYEFSHVFLTPDDVRGVLFQNNFTIVGNVKFCIFLLQLYSSEKVTANHLIFSECLRCIDFVNMFFVYFKESC